MGKLVLGQREMVNIISQRDRRIPAKAVAQNFGVSERTIYRRVKLFTDEDILTKRKVIRRKKLEPEEIEEILGFVRRDNFASYQEIKDSLNLPVSQSSIRRYLKQAGISNYKSPKKFSVKLTNREERVNFASERLRWRLPIWRRLIFTDESGMDNGGAEGVRVLRERGTRFEKENIYKSPNSTFRINFFSWVPADGVGEILTYDKMNSLVYCHEILPVMIEKLVEKFGQSILIIHDNARFSSSKYTEEFMRDNGYDKYFAKMPAYSPDINIIENLRAVVKRRMQKITFTEGQIIDKEIFVDRLKYEWSCIDISIVNNLYESLPKRIKAIVKAGGNLTKF